MKILSDKVKDGGKRRRVTIEIDSNEQLVAVRSGFFYRLGHPIEDVVPAHVIFDAVPVQWCSIEQRWVS